MTTEQWKDIPGYRGRYQVSDLGRVKSLPRRVRLVTSQAGETTRSVPERVLRPGRQPSGHMTVCLGKGNTQHVHKLVLLAFTGPCPEGYEVLHLDHNPANNAFSNLRYGTRSDNLKMDYEAGVRKTHPNFNRWGYRYDNAFS